MSDEKFIRLAIKEAKKSERKDGAPIGAILVKDGEVVAAGWSLVWPMKDPSAHAETQCMRNACKKLETLDLSGHTLYSTLESCSMCLGCAGWTGLSRIVFGAYREDVPDNPYEVKDYHAESHAKDIRPIGGGKLEITGGILRDECRSLMENIKNWSPVG